MFLTMHSTVRDTTKNEAGGGRRSGEGKEEEHNKCILFEQSFCPTLGKVHPFFNDFVMAFEQMLSSGQ